MSNTLPSISCNVPASLSALKVLMLPSKSWVDYKDLANKALDRGDLVEASAMYHAALKIAVSNGVIDAEIGHIHEQLVGIYFDLHELEEAESHCKEALVHLSRAYGSRHALIGNCLNNLAGVYFAKGRLTDAEAICQSVLRIYEKAYGCSHPEVGLAMHNLAMVYHVEGKLAHAEKHYRRAYSLRATALGRNDPTVIKLINNYSALLESTGRADQALRLRNSTVVQKAAIEL